MQWFAQAPSNIALIKYMGKKDATANIPNNPSLSYTLNNLISNVMMEQQSGKQDFWMPLQIPGAKPFNLSQKAQTRYLNHLVYLKSYFNYSGSFIVHSSNNFPHSNGLASSASSFAALTKCAVVALSELTNTPMPSIEIQASLARQGSGSACRSFFSPWALWEGEAVNAVDIPYQELIHQVIVISHEEKEVSSSEAHRRITGSSLYPTRAARASLNLKSLIGAFEAGDWASAYRICWREFHDMHQLFATSNPPFSYINQSSNQLLKIIQMNWEANGDGPLVTMDAGPNIHLLYRLDQQEMATQFKQEHLLGQYDVL